MKLKLLNIGILNEAEIIVDGLTLIAGENDSGKSTVGKVLYALIKTIRWASSIGTQDRKKVYINQFNSYIKKLFNQQISLKGEIHFECDQNVFYVYIEHHRCVDFVFPVDYKNIEPKVTSPLLIDSPYIWQLLPSLKTINTIENQSLLGSEIDFEIPELLKDLYASFSLKLKEEGIKINEIAETLGGNFVENQNGDYVFKKEQEEIKLVNTAMGIKYLGILQVLSNHNHFYHGQILILDEPEVHLHPNWQLKLAQWIVDIAQQGVKILVNSHSPYMIEAIQRYSKQKNFSAKVHFYLADQHIIMQNDQALSQIFEKLSEPFKAFDQMDSEILNG